ncbi:MAG: UPF0758 domain-containing protein [Thermodesulfobacteriota bacterium]|nr:UPF0758 domain-containing protein [Thermodesulfobacteriota bacterium]
MKPTTSNSLSIKEAIENWPVTERPREELLHLGPEGLSDGELLAVLLCTAKSGESAKVLGQAHYFAVSGKCIQNGRVGSAAS